MVSGVCLCEVCALWSLSALSGVCLCEVCALWSVCVEGCGGVVLVCGGCVCVWRGRAWEVMCGALGVLCVCGLFGCV